MPNFKITGYTELTEPEIDDLDQVEIVDVSDQTMASSGTNKRVSALSLKTWIGGAGGGGPTLWSEGSVVPTQRDIWDFRGNGVRIEDNAGDASSRIIIDNANVANVGGGGEIWRDNTGADPVTVNLRTLVSGDSSVTITQTADALDLRSSGGPGSGEVNTSSNQGTGVDINLAKNGFDLPKKALLATDPAKLTVADGANNNIEFTLVEDGIDHQNLSGAGANTHAAIDNHIGSSPNIHFAASTLPGSGLTESGGQLNVGAGPGITVNANDVAANFAGDGAANTVARSDHDHSANQITGTDAIAAGTVANPQLSSMVQHTVKAGPPGNGSPIDLSVGAATDLGTYGTSDTVLGWDENGVLGKFTSIAGTGSSPTSVLGDMIRRGALADERLPIGTESDVLRVVAGVPAWSALTEVRHVIQDDYIDENPRRALNFRTTAFTVNDEGGTDSTDIFVTNAPSATGDIWTYSGGTPQRLAVGSLGQVLTVGASSLLEWAAGGGGGGGDVNAGTPFTASQLTQVSGANEINSTGILTANVVQAAASIAATNLVSGISGKNVGDSGIASASVVRNDTSANLTAGYTATFATHAQGSTLTPVIASRQWIEVTGSGPLTINPPNANAGGVDVFLPSAITTVTLGGFSSVIGADGTGDRWLSIRRTSTNHTTAIWVANA